MAGPSGNPVSGLPPGAMLPGTTHFKQWLRGVKRVLAPGISTTVALAPTTSSGAAGSLTVINGIITAYTAPT